MSTILHLLRGQMSAPSITWGADVLIYHFSQGGRCPRGEMSGKIHIPTKNFNFLVCEILKFRLPFVCRF